LRVQLGVLQDFLIVRQGALELAFEQKDYSTKAEHEEFGLIENAQDPKEGPEKDGKEGAKNDHDVHIIRR
jgi:hypothetical protein